MLSITPVVLSGGSGSRLWPSSRSMYPKQFLKLMSDNTMLQDTLMRLSGLESLSDPVIVSNVEHRFLVAEQLKSCGIEAGKIILEPDARNTAPAIALAALSMLSNNESVMLVLPADHVVTNLNAFYSAISVGRAQAEAGQLVTFGVVPDEPHTGYGYIRSGDKLASGVFSVDSFSEKPDLKTAERFLLDGRYSWNSGIFMFRPSVYLEELESIQPDIFSACKAAYDEAVCDMDFVRVGVDQFKNCPSNSIDYAVMERTNNAVVVPMDVGWSDLGSWSALWEKLEKNRQGNVFKGDVIGSDVSNSLIVSDEKLIACVGVQDIVLVETDDAILLAHKDKVQDVKGIVQYLIDKDRSEAKLHRKVYRPWGYYDSIENADGYQVKRLVVYPGARLSLQMHHHRAEHWVVVKGTAEIINGDEQFLLGVNESTYIPIGAKHQLSNPGKLLLELIEVQSGSYLGEDDIVRYNDIYGRCDGE